MTNVSLVGNDGVTFTFEDGEVDAVESEIAAGPEIQTLFGSGPASNFAYDYEGVSKVITIRGELYAVDTTRTSSGTTTSILQQKQWLEKQLNGSQVLKQFASNYESQSYDGSSFQNTKIMASRITFREETENPSGVTFSMRLLVGGS